MIHKNRQYHITHKQNGSNGVVSVIDVTDGVAWSRIVWNGAYSRTADFKVGDYDWKAL